MSDESVLAVGAYTLHMRRSRLLLIAQILLTAFLLLVSLSIGPFTIPLERILSLLVAPAEASRMHAVIFGIRLPQAVAGLLCGASLAAAGAVMQIILHNPLGSPFTLGISNAAAFGASLSFLIFPAGSALISTTAVAFIFSLAASAIILLISYTRSSSPEVMVLVGVALSSLFSAGVMLLQYAADDTQLAAMVFWTFGDTSRVSWQEISIITAALLPVMIFLMANRWSLHAMLLGDENAYGVGVSVSVLRLAGMGAAALVTAIVISFAGVIGFVGLAAPHITKRVIGEGNPYYLISSLFTGAILLSGADLISRTVFAPRVLPVAILTSFLGAPLFIYLIVTRYRR